MRKLSLFTLLVLCYTVSFSQKVTIKGTVADSIENTNLQYATVSLLKQKDSVLVTFDRAGQDGSFHLNGIDTGHYVLMVSYPKYADYVDFLHFPGAGQTDLGKIRLIPASKLLEEVIVKQNRAIRMRGDTVEYTADSFKVRDGASVKDLLKVMPGLQVDNKGQVTAQGQKVEKVLVDGEEFFSDDPAVVIENLRADAIDKVQSFDKKSDQAEFTGIDDGSRSKTLNLVLKEDKKKGYFGKVVIGGGTQERYSEEAMINFFKGKKKVSVYGIGSNTGKTGLGWEDRGKFGEENDFGDATVEMGAGFIMISGDGDNDFSDWSNQYSDEGIPSTFKAGLHFSDKWNKDYQHVNSDYSIRTLNTNATGSSLTKYILPDSAYYSKENHTSSNRETRQLISGIYDFKIDSLASLKIKFNGKKQDKKQLTVYHAESDDENQNPVNDNYRKVNSNSTDEVYLGSILWRQKFRKKGRTLSLLVSQKYNQGKSDGYLFSSTNFYDGFGTIYRRDTTDQFKSSLSKMYTTASKLVYTEPISKKSVLEFNYALSRISNDAERKSFDKLNGKYDAYNNTFSNSYALNYLSNSAGIKYQFNSKKIVLNLGSNIGISQYRQKDSSGTVVNHFNYTNLFPTSRITYKFSAQRSLNLSYSGSPQPPSIDQIQPVQDNTNSLFIKVGNPLLKQAFQHSVSLFFTDFKMLTGRNIWINASISPTQDAIVTSQTTSNGITTQQYINTSGNYNYYLYTSYGLEIKKAHMNINFSVNSNGSRYVNFVNTQKNISNYQTTGAGIGIYKYKEDRYDFGINSSLNMNHSTSSINPVKTKFLSQEINANLNFYIKKKFRIGSDINTSLRQKTDAFDKNNNFTVWNAYLGYKIFKKNNGEFKLEVNDILKQRRGYDRSFSSNTIYERNYNTLGQYAMLSFTWNFTKNPGTTK